RRQSTARPPAEGLRFVPVHVRHRMPCRQRHDRVEATLAPSTVTRLLPEERMIDGSTAAPVPASPAPQFTAAIPAVVDEARELRVCDWRRANPERGHLDLVRPPLVVEDEWFVGGRAETESAARDVDVARRIRRIDREIGRAGYRERHARARI